MVEKTCEVCGSVSSLGAVAQHPLVPLSEKQKVDVSDLRQVNLCRRCHLELQAWYRGKVAHTLYDPKIKRFRPKLWEELVKEYESTLAEFKHYKESH